jgi:HAD superfamily hydrolase (TIGR01484 family)
MMRPLADIPPGVLRRVRAILTDIDDTLTTDGRLPAVAYGALEKLQRAGLMVVPVTGRPAGWCDMIARFWPVDGVVGENGAFYFRYLAAERRMQRTYAQDAQTRAANFSKLQAISESVLKAFPGTALASDQAYREIDVAIDFSEDVDPLPISTANEIARHFAVAGAVAKVSSIHVNAWFGTHDKLSMAQKFLADVCGLSAGEMLSAVAYCGDSPNDAPMFAHFPISIGVANVGRFSSVMVQLPAFVTKAEGGAGFAEFAERLLAAQL